MLFNSFDFFLFFPVVTILFFLLPQKFRWFLLLSASCFFYMYFIPAYILILFFTIFIDYFAGIYLEDTVDAKRKKIYLACSIVANVGVLAVFKYYNFFLDNLNHASGLFAGLARVPLQGLEFPAATWPQGPNGLLPGSVMVTLEILALSF